jgi:hypothetical protein
MIGRGEGCDEGVIFFFFLTENLNGSLAFLRTETSDVSTRRWVASVFGTFSGVLLYTWKTFEGDTSQKAERRSARQRKRALKCNGAEK